MKLIHAIATLALLGAGSMVQAADGCTLTIKGDDAMKFDLKEMTVSAGCPTITLELIHTGKLPVAVMGHNAVVSRTPDLVGIARDAITAGAANHYMPPNDARVIAATPLIGGGEKTQVTFPGSALAAGSDYSFFCSFPGHSTFMKGKLVVIE